MISLTGLAICTVLRPSVLYYYDGIAIVHCRRQITSNSVRMGEDACRCRSSSMPKWRPARRDILLVLLLTLIPTRLKFHSQHPWDINGYLHESIMRRNLSSKWGGNLIKASGNGKREFPFRFAFHVQHHRLCYDSYGGGVGRRRASDGGSDPSLLILSWSKLFEKDKTVPSNSTALFLPRPSQRYEAAVAGSEPAIVPRRTAPPLSRGF